MEATAILRNVPTSPRKMRLVADIIRGMNVTKALATLRFQPQHASETLYKVLRNAIANFEQKHEGQSIENLVVKTIFVNEGRQLKRVQPAPQGRAHRIRKRSNHIHITVGHAGQITMDDVLAAAQADTQEQTTEA